MTNTKNDNPSTSVSTKTKPKPKHDRTIDRRKSPALWRYDLDYSISPTSTADALKHASLKNEQQFDYHIVLHQIKIFIPLAFSLQMNNMK